MNTITHMMYTTCPITPKVLADWEKIVLLKPMINKPEECDSITKNLASSTNLRLFIPKDASKVRFLSGLLMHFECLFFGWANWIVTQWITLSVNETILWKHLSVSTLPLLFLYYFFFHHFFQKWSAANFT